ncbi:hypothetical protein ACFQ34_07130 [Pseudonocardia benzenivorans]|uniref:Uncharacterized protein n=1 Tax=Pseudonocardia benzenivorans TaxID=228005 RepID=A0ABW3VEI8_9PSEU|nr:hypothetical protein [Pseudonocardia dioxanivorans]GJF07134.1 hypothetical protein PSD17_60810 [Pseudonocardia sp. D17]
MPLAERQRQAGRTGEPALARVNRSGAPGSAEGARSRGAGSSRLARTLAVFAPAVVVL